MAVNPVERLALAALILALAAKVSPSSVGSSYSISSAATSFNLKGARIARISLTLPGLWLAMITRWPLSNANEWLLAEG